uniref:Uncharacterized protein n=1 Tax=Arundo donax TaxID=35708 RepID=A0A0A9CPK3_ARUDO
MATKILECKSFTTARVLSIFIWLSPLDSWCLSCLRFSSYCLQTAPLALTSS